MSGIPDYTNVIGKTFFGYVKDQLAKRAEILSKGGGNDPFVQRTPQELEWLTNRSGWVRVTSNIQIRPSTEKQPNPLANKYGAGSGLAKKYVLQGGVVFADASLNNGSTLRSGVGADKAYGVGFQNGDAYGMGLKPMPGITGFSIECSGPFGALKTANIKIKTYDLEQFNIIETLYLHLGMSVIVEFGHVPYIDNSGKFVSTPKLLDVFNINSKEQIAQNITSQRSKTGGNYDALFGTVINYSWTTSNDGSYDIDLKVMGPGSVLESISINYTTPNVPPVNPKKIKIYEEFLAQNAGNAETPPAAPPTPPADGASATTEGTGNAAQAVEDPAKALLPGVIASRNNSIIHRHLYRIYEDALVNQQVTNPASGLEEGGDATKAMRASTTPTLTNEIFTQNKTYKFLKLSGNSVTGNNLALKGNNAAAISGTTPIDKIPAITTNLFQYLTVAYVTNPDEGGASATATTKDQLPRVYIPFGYLLAIIQSSGVLYNSSNGEAKAKDTRPFIYLDFNNRTNFCFAYPWAVSVDPNVCLVDIANGPELNNALFKGSLKVEGFLFEDAALVKDEKGNYLTRDQDINTQKLIASNNLYKPEQDKLSKTIQNAGLGFYAGENKGRIMNILLNIEYIVNKMDSLAGSSDKKEVRLDRFLNDILTDVNKSLGGVNEFRVAFLDESYCIQITDEQRLEQPIPSTIDVIGLNSIVQNYSFSSKISPQLASMLVIGAQAGGTSQKQATTDASSVGQWNAYVKDRIMPAKVDSTEGDEGAAGGTQQTPAAPASNEDIDLEDATENSPDDQLSRLITGTYCKLKYSESDIEGARTTLKDKLLELKANLEDTSAAPMIPLEMSIKMDGISGILVNQMFVIPPARLPLSYQGSDPSKTRLGFVVRKIENTIESNRWITSITGQSLFLKKEVSAGVKLTSTNFKSTAPASPAPSRSGTNPSSTTDPTVQRQEQENLQRITVNNSGKNTTTNTYTYLPKTTTKEVNVLIFYPGINIGGVVGRDYMPKKVTEAAADWFDKYVLVFPTTWTTPFSKVKSEYQELLTKAGLTQKTLSIGIYSGSGNNSASVLAAVKSSGRELRNFIMMDPVPSNALVEAVNAVKNRGGTFQYLYYNPSAWGGASYYGGANANGLYGNIKTLVDAGAGKVGMTKTSIGHYDIPAAMLKAYKSQIEKNLG